ncbi:MAG: hypothetical protein ACO3FE_20615, partial [Planctomycetaceae bacterium]
MPDLRKVPIFSVGEWNGLKFSEEDLDDIAENFESLREIHKVPLKLGHNDEQPMTDGQPALGWADNVRRQGDKLIADFTDVPRILRNAIKARRFRSVSVELLMGVKRGDSVLRHVLDAVAILGADQPAVNNLGDLEQFLATRSMQFDDAGHRICFEAIAGTLKTDGDRRMNETEIQTLVDAAVAKFTKTFESQLSEKDAEIERLQAKLEKAQSDSTELDELRQFRAESQARSLEDKRDMAKQILEDAVKGDLILPAQRERFMTLYGIDDDARLAELDLKQFRQDFAVEGAKEKGSSTGMQNSVDER